MRALIIVVALFVALASGQEKRPEDVDTRPVLPLPKPCDSPTPCCPKLGKDGIGGYCYPNDAVIQNTLCCRYAPHCCAFKCVGSQWQCTMFCDKD